jgi:hypothetical protein
MSAANSGSNRFHQNRTVSRYKSMSRSNGKSSTLRRDNRNGKYISTTSRITSGEVLKRRNGLDGRALDLLGIGGR